MKHLLLFLLLTSLSQFSSAKKAYYSLEMLINYADLIVVGELSNSGVKTYNFTISSTIKGEEHESIRVQKFKEWTCDTRSRKFESGQKIILFLEKKLGKYEIINGSSGEVFIDDNIVQVRGFHQKPTVNEFSGMISDFLACFSPNNEPSTIWNTRTYTQLLSDDEITERRNKSMFTDKLFATLEEEQITK